MRRQSEDDNRCAASAALHSVAGLRLMGLFGEGRVIGGASTPAPAAD